MDLNTKQRIESFAWDATVGTGNDDETVNYGILTRRLGREPTFDECKVFRSAWLRSLQEMAQP